MDPSVYNRFVQQVREAARPRWLEILMEVGGLARELLDEKHHGCPKCGGKDRFRLIDAAAGATLCNQCHSEKNGDGFATISWLRTWSYRETFRAVGEYLGVSLDESSFRQDSMELPPQTTELASADFRDEVYRAVLAECPLSQQHRVNLMRRGLIGEAVDRLSYGSLPKERRSALATKLVEKFGASVMGVPGLYIGENKKSGERFLSFAGAVGMLIPVRDTKGRITALKVRSDEAKPGGRYSAVSSKSKAGPGPGAPIHVPLGTPVNPPVVRITEGELKADIAAHLSGRPTIAIPGVGNTNGLVDALSSIGATTVLLSLDGDARTNQAVAIAASRIISLLRKAGFVLEVETWPADHKGIDDCLLAGVAPQVLTGEAVDRWTAETLAACGVVKPDTVDENDPRPEIPLSANEHEVTRQALAALAADPNLYSRDGSLVSVLDDEPARIHGLSPALIRERLSANCRFTEIVGSGENMKVVQAHPPAYTINALFGRGEYPGIPRLTAVAPFPVVRPDGTVADQWGYDRETELFVAFRGALRMPEAPTRDDALASVRLLLDLVSDFPFEKPCHQSAWLALALTVTCRHLIDGPVPLWLVDANTRGSGKSLLAEIISLIVLGNAAARMSQPESEDEARKRFTALVLSGALFVLLDNLVKEFGGASIDSLTTSTEWSDRVLGESRTFTGKVCMTIVATGNNVALKADTSRRVCHIRLRSPLENPEERSGFKHPDLRQYVLGHRAELLGAVLTILRAYILAGRPQSNLRPWGSFEAWDTTVRHALVWLGLADPGETRQELTRLADRGAAALGQLLEAWPLIDPKGTGLTSAEIIHRLSSDFLHDELFEFRDALAELCPTPNGVLPTVRQLGNKLRFIQARVVGGRFIDSRSGRANTVRWVLVDSDNGAVQESDPSQRERLRGESGESGESGSRYPTRGNPEFDTKERDPKWGERGDDSPDSPDSPHQPVEKGVLSWTE